MSRLKEQRAWDRIRDANDPRTLKLVRIENLCGEGTPDLIGQNRNGTVFWLENKALEEWPKRASTPVLSGAFRPGQIPFMEAWRQWNGHAFVLLRVGLEFYLFLPSEELYVNTKSELILKALAVGKAAILNHLKAL